MGLGLRGVGWEIHVLDRTWFRVETVVECRV